MDEVKLSSKNQIVIPRQAREALRLKAGDRIRVVVKGDRVLILERPKSHHEAIRGLSRRSYPRDYLKRERTSWD